VKVGDLVKYNNTAYQSEEVGIILQRDSLYDEGRPPYSYRVLWRNHNESKRNWYGYDELRKL